MDWEHKPELGRSSSPEQASNVVAFRSRTALPLERPGRGRIIHPLEHFEEQEERLRMQQNIAAAAVVVLLVLSGFWVIDHLRTSARIEACVEAGHRNCVPLDMDKP